MKECRSCSGNCSFRLYQNDFQRTPDHYRRAWCRSQRHRCRQHCGSSIYGSDGHFGISSSVIASIRLANGEIEASKNISTQASLVGISLADGCVRCCDCHVGKLWPLSVRRERMVWRLSALPATFSR